MRQGAVTGVGFWLRARRAAVVLGAAVWGACSGREGAGGTTDSPAATSAAASGATSTPVTSPAGCPLEGDWQRCSVEDRLTHAGIVFTARSEPASVAFLRPDGVVYDVGDREDEVRVFLFPSADARRAATDVLDSATASPRGTRHNWGAPPTLVTSNNLAAVILSLNDRTVERLALALGAGLPQPK